LEYTFGEGSPMPGGIKVTFFEFSAERMGAGEQRSESYQKDGDRREQQVMKRRDGRGQGIRVHAINIEHKFWFVKGEFAEKSSGWRDQPRP
jgi:hypothetical protein